MLTVLYNEEVGGDAARLDFVLGEEVTKDPTPTAERSDLRKSTEGSEEATKDPTPTAERSDLRKSTEGSEEATKDPTPTAERSDLREEAT